MIIDNARHRMEPEPHHNPQQIYSNFTQEIQTCQLGVETCAAAALQHLALTSPPTPTFSTARVVLVTIELIHIISSLYTGRV